MANVSVIIPIYNCKDYLEKCIDSVLNQSYQDFELILVDDGSTDGSESICDVYSKKDNRIRTLHKENGGGAGEARNQGVLIASSPFLVFLDSDDYLEEYHLEKLLEAQREDDYDVVVSGYIEYVEGEDEKFHQYVHYPSLKLNNRTQVRDFFVEHYPEGLLGFPWNKLYKTEIIRRNQLVFPKMRRLEDGIFNVEYFGECENCRIVEDTRYYYKNSEQVELRKLPYDFYDIMEVFVEQFYKTLESWGYEKEVYEKSMVDYFQNDFVCCLENISQPIWKKTKKERLEYMKELRQKSLVCYMSERPCLSGNYTKIVWRVFCEQKFRGVFFLTAIKRFLKTKCKKVFYNLKKGLN